jgi:type IV pilus assembly protein PilA
MHLETRSAPRRSAFTLLELMVVVAIIGILAAIAIPQYLRFQLRSKSAEGKINLASIRTAQDAYFSEHGRFIAAAADPAAIPGRDRVAFDAGNAGFRTIGFEPEGKVYFSYAAAVSADGTGMSLDAAADLDGNLVPQFWGYTRHDGGGALVPAIQGCDVTAIAERQVAPCDSTFGQSIF